VVARGTPSELLLYVFGRRAHALVEISRADISRADITRGWTRHPE
jgi:hypothetical protein